MLHVIRLVLNVLAIKWLRITKVTYYIEFLILAAENFIPVPVTLEIEMLLTSLFSYLFFALSYFNFWADMGTGVAFFTLMCANRVFLYGDPVDVVMMHGILILPWHLFNFLCVHIALTKFGFLFVDAEVLRSGNEQLLNNLEEGVIILDETSNKILFYNAATHLSKDAQS